MPILSVKTPEMPTCRSGLLKGVLDHHCVTVLAMWNEPNEVFTLNFSWPSGVSSHFISPRGQQKQDGAEKKKRKKYETPEPVELDRIPLFWLHIIPGTKHVHLQLTRKYTLRFNRRAPTQQNTQVPPKVFAESLLYQSSLDAKKQQEVNNCRPKDLSS